MTGNKFVSSKKVAEIVSDVVGRRFLMLVDRNNFLLIPKSVIASKIEEELAVQRAVVKIVDINQLDVEIIEYKPWATWCRDECFFVNEKGVAFAPKDDSMNGSLISLVGTHNEESLLGQNYTDSETFEKFATVQRLLLQLDVTVSQISTEDFETFQFQTKAGPYLLIDKHDDPVEVINNLKTTLDQESIHDIQFGNIEYFDLRFEDKTFYKIK